MGTVVPRRMAKARCSVSPCFEFIPDDILKKSAVANHGELGFHASQLLVNALIAGLDFLLIRAYLSQQWGI
jgi:hypothetical protein